MSSRPLVQLLDPQWVGGLNHYPMGKIKLVQQAIGPTAGPIVGWRTNPPPDWDIGPVAGPVVGWRIKTLLLGRTNLSSKPLIQLLDPLRAGGFNRSQIGKSKLVQQAIGPAAGPIAGWRIKPLPYWEDQACPAGQLVQLLDP